ncbi:MAG: hypothetical protein HWN68_14145 [Desulfobacterales bacterium]|nr:hypothetical protein [Desulfobacterales bacterium]
MKGNVLSIFAIIFLIVGTVEVAAVGTASLTPVISVKPSTMTAEVGEAFAVDITVADITSDESLYGWEFRMSFDPNILNATSVVEGPFLKTVGDTSWGMMAPKIDNYRGWVNASDALWTYPPQGATSSGVLCNITFQVKAEGKTSLNFNRTELFTYDGDWIVPMDHGAVDGFFAYPLLRDIAVTGVTASPASVPAGEPVSINVTVENEGEVSETFDITVLYDSTDIETKTVTDLAPGSSETLSFSWDTEDVDEGNYTITAEASEIGGETDTADNTYTDVVVAVTVSSFAFPIQLFVAVIIAVATMCSVVVLYLRRRRPTKP